jgi:hypothetical protein
LIILNLLGIDLLSPAKTISSGLGCVFRLVKRIKYVLTILATLLAIAFYHWGVTISDDSKMTLLLGTTAIIATIITIAFSLSIIPIERASENFSAGLIHLVLKDSETKIAFYILSFLTVLPLSGFFCFVSKMGKQFPLCLSVFVIGAALDVLRFYQQNLIPKLQPSYVIRALLKEVKLEISKDKTNIAKLLKQWKIKADQELSDDRIEAALQYHFSSLDSFLTLRCNSLFDGAKKIIDQGNRHILKETLDDFVKIVHMYLSQRADSAVTFQDKDFLLVTSTNVATVPNEVIEHLGRLSKCCLNKKDELLVKMIHKTFMNLVLEVNRIKFKNFTNGKNPVLSSILGRWTIEAEEVAKEGMIDATMDDSGNLNKVMEVLAQRENFNNIYPTVIRAQISLLHSIAAAYATNKTSLSLYEISTNRVIENTTAILSYLIKIKHRQCDDISSAVYHVLNTKNLLDQQLKIEYGIMNSNPAYQSTDENNIFHINAHAIVLIEKSLENDESRHYFFDFMTISEHVLDHLNKLVQENTELATKFQYQIVEGINVLLSVYLEAFNLIRGHAELDAEINKILRLIKRTIGVITFFKVINPQFADNFVQHLTIFGIRIIQTRPDILWLEPELIKKIAETQRAAATSNARFPSDFEWWKTNAYAKVVANNWWLAKALRLKKRDDQADEILALAETFPSEFSESEKTHAAEILREMYDSYEKEVAIGNPSMFRDEPLNLILSMIDQINNPPRD